MCESSTSQIVSLTFSALLLDTRMRWSSSRRALIVAARFISNTRWSYQVSQLLYKFVLTSLLITSRVSDSTVTPDRNSICGIISCQEREVERETNCSRPHHKPYWGYKKIGGYTSCVCVSPDICSSNAISWKRQPMCPRTFLTISKRRGCVGNESLRKNLLTNGYHLVYNQHSLPLSLFRFHNH